MPPSTSNFVTGLIYSNNQACAPLLYSFQCSDITNTPNPGPAQLCWWPAAVKHRVPIPTLPQAPSALQWERMGHTLRGARQGRAKNRTLKPCRGQRKQLLGSHQQCKWAEGIARTTQHHQENSHQLSKIDRSPNARALLILSQAMVRD